MTADTVVAGVHADLSLTGLDDLGWKAVCAAVSDVAAMGGDAGPLLIAVTAPPGTDLELLYAGVAAAARETGCPVVGGDLTDGDQIVVTVTVTGVVDGPAVTRGGARAGDEVWVTGPLGASAAGLRLLRAATSTPATSTPAAARAHRASGSTPAAAPAAGSTAIDAQAIAAHARPLPKLAAGRAARSAGATAMIDISDGLLADLEHIAVASGVGFRLEGIPVHPAAELEEALSGGEDYQLAFCAPPGPPPGPTTGAPPGPTGPPLGPLTSPSTGADLRAAFAQAGEPQPVRIGVCTADPDERSLDGVPYTPRGWEHGL